ncbi:restriction endonuclease [Dictyobacter formicarum]|uniref:Restriction endonuclease type IV Mrr domain-containing protein n=1 Tax=Dictyobacter formicarum TaxID=2778368 RepID=A0ABQ3VPG5_9CHLR|nr:restriction endonuclease [Dictyobacter formicarum]GHO88137.1 hypothetical protein KSZ_61430 [Dictyobacter formicarum]GHO88257.1 hypothetical protein KSZ_62630 [Dictyobacter formicarum]
MRSMLLPLGALFLFLLFALVRLSVPALAFVCFLGGTLLVLLWLSLLCASAPRRAAKSRVAVRAVPSPEVVRPRLSIPTTAQMAHAKLSDVEFELFAAAVIIGGERLGHTFVRHCGKTGDKGTDVVLRDRYTRPVCVQAKRYRLGSAVKSSQVREFSSSIRTYRAHSGYIVTTSTLTRDGINHVADENARAPRGEGKEMHVIDHQRLNELLRSYPVEIERAWQYILAQQVEKSS